MRVLLAALMVAGVTIQPVAAGCATDVQIDQFVTDYMSNSPTAALSANGTIEDALCAQKRIVAALEPHMGPVIGYKAGLTSAPAQERFGASEPVQGVLFRDMMLQDGASVPSDWGARPVFEADLVLVVGAADINNATTPEEVLTHVSTIRPFIELPDLTLAEGEPITPVTLTAIGVAPKLGVLGAEIPVSDPAAMSQALADMTVVLSAADGDVLAEAPGRAVLDHPANAALWLISKGVEFKPGDLISVGSFGPLFPPAKGKGGASVTYEGLPGDPTVSVVFD
ncbi:2-keto-4-pentenoate hydratase [Ruegeria sp. Ofav3-42]|uniref:2-keto-4-pentenoate hydratase n=1 Tax=Ruegeria sp. Ofav3-42 TaxID=2917759 RepID=UPI001EF3E723|nr:fumarylacetoacetate hydrolase family protein [Ruegeria sp. Ofav3-42]MCG7521132.1 fumarylacetoacetate hydrolase family protein [Ruegeria sp. Ofav3-42]